MNENELRKAVFDEVRALQRLGRKGEAWKNVGYMTLAAVGGSAATLLVLKVLPLVLGG